MISRSIARARMLIVVFAIAICMAALAVAGSGAWAVVAIDRQDETGKTLDVRDEAGAIEPTREQLRAVRAIANSPGEGIRVTWDDRFGTPSTIYPSSGTLTGPQSGGAADIARAWINDNRDALGLTAADVQSLAVTQNHRLGTGSRIVNFSQVFDGVQTIHGGSMTVTVRDDGSVESYAGQSVRHTALAGGWGLSSAQALERVAGALAPGVAFDANATGEQAGYTAFAKGPFAASSYVKKAVFATNGGARPAYQALFIKDLDEAWDVVVDARTGDILFRDSLVDHNRAEGTVYENFPGDAGSGGQPVIESFEPTPESPSGYVDPTGLAGVNGPTTFGNNANSYANYSNFLVPADQGPRPVSPLSHFNYVYEMNWQRTNGQEVPPSYVRDLDPAATNLFYHHNRIHDEFYSFGFTESGDNFQVNNYGKDSGVGDPILGLVHAGAATGGEPTYTGRDNAYMLTLPDGIPPWSGMFLWEPINDAFEGPYSDGNFDATVIEHEYAHGLSNRYVSEEDNALGTHQSGSMGEGWGDWYALNYLHREGLYNKSIEGEYVTGNSTRGIRNWSYDDNPTTYADIGYDIVGPEVHADGEIWTAILWDYRQKLVAEFGQAKGSEIAQLTITDAMPRSPVNSSFLDMRDAIQLAIDDRYHDSTDYERIFHIFWTEFAQRGAGFHAQTESGDDLDPTPAFDHPNERRNGTLAGKVINAATGNPIADARVMLGKFEAGVSPLRTTGATGGFSAPVVSGTYPVTIQARGFGSQTFEAVKVTAGQTNSLQFELSPNLASEANGAKVVSATSPNAQALMDDTEASKWSSKRRGNAVIELAKPAEISSVQLSAYTTSRFEALRDFTLQVSNDGTTWRNVLVEKRAFTYQKPRPVAPDVHYKTFALAEPTKAKFVRFYTDAPQGETKTKVQAAELQVFSGTVKDIEPLPPPPPDPPYTDEGTIAFSTPGGDATDGGVTAVDFQTNCIYPPATQGSDGYVSKLPESFGDGLHQVKVTGTGPAEHDLDLYFYSADCEVLGSAASSAADESGTIPSGTRYVLTHLWLGAGESFTLRATDTG